ncbi:MAG TPA: hypothetical protein VL242_34935 [Sorangium sp.]|nr:hypothetical protein [Sorangium sp.]
MEVGLLLAHGFLPPRGDGDGAGLVDGTALPGAGSMAGRADGPSGIDTGPCRTLYGGAVALEGGVGDRGAETGRGIDGGAAVGVDAEAAEGGGTRRLNGTELGGAEAAPEEPGTGETMGGR